MTATVHRAREQAQSLGLETKRRDPGDGLGALTISKWRGTVNNAADEFDAAESIWIFFDARQIRRIEWRTLAGIRVIRAGDLPVAISAVAL